jgi:hypothetical protein
MSSRGDRPNPPASLSHLLAESPILRARSAGITAAEWKGLVGPRLAERAILESVSDGVLTVRVPSSTWAQELSFLSHLVIERLQGNGHAVNKIRFRVAAPSNPRSVLRKTSEVHKAPLPPALRARLEKIDDPDLRAAIGEAAALSLGRQKPKR